jgi:4-amino-4-deoxy-L-arabinose transferase-like glycosyltransferase
MWTAVVLLLGAFGLALTSARVKSATFDEDAYVGKGTAIWIAGNYGLEIAHPPLGPMLSTLPLLTEPELALPLDHGCWPDGTARSCGRELLFFRSDTRRVLLLARLPSLFLTLVLATLVHHWAAELFGRKAGLVAFILCAFDPNILAHGRLVTLDLVTTLIIFLTCFLFWRFWRRPTRRRLVTLGVALGMAGATHFATGLLVPILIIASLARAWHPLEASGIPALRAPFRWRRWAVTLGLLLVAGAVSLVVIWGIHSFSIGPVSRWQDIRLPAPAFFNELARRLQEKPGAPNSFLLGRHYTGGWWPYFLVAFLVKTPLPTILLMALAVTNLIRQGGGRFADLLLLAVPGVYFVAASLSDFNRGYRYILPILPFLFVLGGRAACSDWGSVPDKRRSWLGYVPTVLLGWLVTTNAMIYPHYLAYFNELVGPRNGYRVLVDSSLDWGQDLPALERYVEEHEVSFLYLSWFGESRPSQYDIPHRFIPSKPDELTDIFTRVYHPEYPPPGTYAISATNLQGLLFDDKDLFGYFLDQEPVAQPGYSVMIYKVPRLLDLDAAPVSIALGGTAIDQVPSGVFEDSWRTNDLGLRWFDPETSCILPADSEVWYVLNAQTGGGAFPCPYWEQAQTVAHTVDREARGELLLYRLQPDQAALGRWLDKVTKESGMIISDEVSFAAGEAPEQRQVVSPPVDLGDRLDLVGYDTSAERLQPGEAWHLVTYWKVAADGGRPLKAFVQLLDDGGHPRAQYDGFDIPSIGWRTGDLLVQRHSLSVPVDLEPGRYWVQMGLYAAATKERLPVLLSDGGVSTRVLLSPLEVE